MTAAFVPQVLGNAEGDQVSALRASAYRNLYGPNVDVSAMRWNPRLTHVLNLGVTRVETGGTPPTVVSAYRLDIINDRSFLHGVLQTRKCVSLEPALFQTIEEVSLPTIVGCRASTLPEYQNQSFHFALRYWAVRILIQIRAPALIGTFESSNPWSETLEKMGYELRSNPSDWTEFLKNNARPTVGILNLEKNGRRAESILRSRLIKSIGAELFSPIDSFDIATSSNAVLQAWIEEYRAMAS